MAYIASIGLAWYREADYEKLKLIFDDAHVLPKTYKNWLQLAENGRRKFVADGYLVVQAYIDPQTFPAWCSARGLKIDAKARMQFASAEAHEAWKKLH